MEHEFNALIKKIDQMMKTINRIENKLSESDATVPKMRPDRRMYEHAADRLSHILGVDIRVGDDGELVMIDPKTGKIIKAEDLDDGDSD